MTDEIGYNRSTLLEMLHSREVSIKFLKQDGSVRILRGTLVDSLIPQQKESSSKRKHSSSTDVITVWDLDSAGWRSFSPSSVLEVH